MHPKFKGDLPAEEEFHTNVIYKGTSFSVTDDAVLSVKLNLAAIVSATGRAEVSAAIKQLIGHLKT